LRPLLTLLALWSSLLALLLSLLSLRFGLPPLLLPLLLAAPAFLLPLRDRRGGFATVASTLDPLVSGSWLQRQNHRQHEAQSRHRHSPFHVNARLLPDSTRTVVRCIRTLDSCKDPAPFVARKQ
jgi:hypothetical protein